MTMIWTEDRVETLKKLWGEGLTASQIAERFEGVSRNAVIGKLHRVGAPPRLAPVAARPIQAKPVQTRPVRRAPTEAAQIPSEDPVFAADLVGVPAIMIEEPGLATTITLQAHMCKWPIGDPAENGFTFCGQSANKGRPYCARHAGAAYKPAYSPVRRGLSPDLSRLVARYA